MQSGVGDTGEAIYLTQTNNTYIQAISIRPHITKKPSEIVYLNLRKASVIQVMAILPNSHPSTGWRRGYLTNNCIKEIFDVGETQVFQNCNDKPQLPGTLPQPLNVRRHQEQCSRHTNIRMIPRYPRDPKKIVKFEERRVKTLCQEASPERRRD